MNSKIRCDHLERRAVIYLRQSTMRQVYENRESTARQYALKQRAAELGWPESSITVVDCDLGQSGRSASDRAGFQQLAEDVAHRRVGLILSLEASRLARSSADWHHLLELCGLASVLIGDELGLYDPADPNDRMLLGLKGEMSEAELYWMRLRLHGARMSKASRGELRINAPAGYQWNPALSRLCLDPNEEVCNAIRLIFSRFKVEGSTRKVAQYFAKNALRLPHYDFEASEMRWLPPRATPILNILRNPAYAGAYVFGRREERKGLINGQIRRRCTVWLPPDQWKVCLHDWHPAYLTWEDFMANLERLEANCNNHGLPKKRGAVREGGALLQGLALCGKCGYRMQVRYSSRDWPHYVCVGPGRHSGECRTCWNVAAPSIDNAVTEQLFMVLQIPEIDLSFAVARQAQKQVQVLEAQWHLRIERTKYEARIAERRYKAVDPDNRTVARSLEREWDEKLQAVAQVEREFQEACRQKRIELSDADQRQIRELATEFRSVWGAPTTTQEQRKQIVRTLIREISLTPIMEPTRMTSVRILWEGGAVQEIQIPRPRFHNRMSTPTIVVTRIREMTEKGITPVAIAEELNRSGLKTARGKEWDREAVWEIKRQQKMRCPPPPDDPPTPVLRGRLSTRALAQQYGVTPQIVWYWVENGWLKPTESDSGGNRWRFEVDGAMDARIKQILVHCPGPRARRKSER